MIALRLYEDNDLGWVRVSFQTPEDQEAWQQIAGQDWIQAGLNGEQPLSQARQFVERLRAELGECRVSTLQAVKTNPTTAACPACHD